MENVFKRIGMFVRLILYVSHFFNSIHFLSCRVVMYGGFGEALGIDYDQRFTSKTEQSIS